MQVTIDASASYDPSGRPLASVAWSLVGAAANQTALAALVASANAR